MFVNDRLFYPCGKSMEFRKKETLWLRYTVHNTTDTILSRNRLPQRRHGSVQNVNEKRSDRM